MRRSVHDNLLISYEVQCEARTITLHTEYRVKNKPTEFTNVIFTGVQAYRFQNDAFGNIILGLETVTVETFLEQYGAEISESYRMAGSPPGPGLKILLRPRGICGKSGRKHSFYLRHTDCPDGCSHERCRSPRLNRARRTRRENS